MSDGSMIDVDVESGQGHVESGVMLFTVFVIILEMLVILGSHIANILRGLTAGL